jgi:hypothetical protein
MKTDCTYRQGFLKDVLKDKTSSNKFVGTADMSAFTDRFPKEPQIQLIKSVLGSDMAILWTKVVTERNFCINSTDEYVKYSVGTPMGVYSSWAVATMTLHALVEFSAYELGYPRFRNYLILGDDVAIFDEKVYHRFIDNVTSLGVGVSKEKSTVSVRSAEMAKRFFSEGQEVTGFPIEILAQLKSQPASILEVLRLLKDLDHGQVQTGPVLQIMGKTLSSKYSALLSLPTELGGHPDSLSDIALRINEGVIEDWC